MSFLELSFGNVEGGLCQCEICTPPAFGNQICAKKIGKPKIYIYILFFSFSFLN
jgi:hypothetical protein